jgi:methyl-accepting chemotaxis protein
MKKFVKSMLAVVFVIGLLPQLVWAFGEPDLTDLAKDENTINAMQEFSANFDIGVTGMKDELFTYYDEDFAGEYYRIVGDWPDLTEAKQISENTAALQYLYIKANPNPLGEKDELVDAGDGSAYSEVHVEYHEFFRDIVEDNGLYDLFLVDLAGDIVYTVFKEIDFATSLTGGPYAETNIGEAFEVAEDSDGGVFRSEIEPYFPSYEADAQFLATPIFDGDTKVGVLIVQLPI